MTDKNENQDIYLGFAHGYDLVMKDVDYQAWANHVIDLMNRHGIHGNKILNLACGTGSMEPTWEDLGFKITAIDQSPQMLEVARSKVSSSSQIQFIQDDIRTFHLDDSFDYVFCLYDSLNYLTEPEDVQACFAKVFEHLRPGGGFVFDVATETNILENFAGVTYAENYTDFAYIWNNEYNIRTKICKSEFFFFNQKPGTNLFQRETEVHYQRMYQSRDLIRWLRKAGLEYLESLDGFSLNPSSSGSERVHFIARRNQ